MKISFPSKIFVFVTSVVLGLTFMTGPGMAADVTKIKSDVVKLFTKYAGPDNLLSPDELRRYLKDEQFKEVDGDEDGELSLREYVSSKRYCQQLGSYWDCTTKEAGERWIADKKKATGNVLTAETLYDANQQTRMQIDNRKRAILEATGQAGGGDITQNEMVDYFVTRSTTSIRPRTVKNRMNHLKTFSDSADSVERADFKDFIAAETFADLDGDGSGFLDITEMNKYDHDEYVSDFLNISGNDFLVSSEEFQKVTVNSPNRTEFYHLFDKEFGDNWDSKAHYDNETIAKLDKLTKEFEKERETQIEKLAKKQEKILFGLPWIPNKGLLVLGETVYDKVEEARVINEDKFAVTARLVKDFTTADSEAKAALVGWEKEAGDNDVWSVDAALRFDLPMPGFQAHPAFGMAMERSGQGEDKSELYKYYGIIDWDIPNELFFINSSHIQIGPVYEDEQEKKIEKLTGLIQWEPQLDFHWFATGVRYPLFGNNNISIYGYPIFAVELNDIVEQPEPEEGEEEVEDASFLRLGAKVGLHLGKRLQVTYEIKQRYDLDKLEDDYLFQNAQLELTFDEEKRFSIVFDFEHGRDTPDFKKAEKYSVGLGLKI